MGGRRKKKQVKKAEKKIVRLNNKGKKDKVQKLLKKVQKMKKSIKTKKRSRKAVKKIKKAKKIVSKKLKKLAGKGKTEKAKLLKKVLKKMKKISKRVSKKPKNVIKKIKKAVKKAIHIEYKTDPTKAPKKKPLPAPKGILNIVGKSGLCIESGRKTKKSICGNKESMAWHLKKVGENEYQILSDDGSMLANKGGVNKSGNPIVSIKSNGGKKDGSNVWNFNGIRNGQFILVNPATKKCLDTTNKTNIGSGYKLKTCRSDATNE